MRATEVAGHDYAVSPIQERQAWLGRHARAWSEAGLISATQADSIIAFESVDESAPLRRITLVAELATYLGAVIAVAGGAAIIGPNWSGLRLGGQLGVGLAIAVVGFVAGTWMARLGDAGSARVAEFLCTAGAGGTALTTGILVHAFEPGERASYPAAIGAAVLAVGLTLWRGRERPLQLATAGAGAVCLGIGIAMFVDASVWIAAPIGWALAAAFGALAATARVRPRLPALVMASIGMMAASFVLAQESERIASIAATATAVGVVAFAMRDRSMPLLALAMGQFFVATTSLMQTTLLGTAERAFAMVLGLVVVAWVALRAQRIGASPRPAREVGQHRSGASVDALKPYDR